MLVRPLFFRRLIVPILSVIVCLEIRPALGRTTKEIDADLAAAQKQFEDTLRYPLHIFFDPKYKKQMANEGTALTQKRRDLVAERIAADPTKYPILDFNLMKYDAELAYFGDEPAQKRLAAEAADADAAKSETGKLGQLLAAWWNAGADDSARRDALTKVEAIAAADPASESATRTLMMMVTSHPDDVKLGREINDVICTKMKSQAAKDYAVYPLKLDAPLEVKGTTLKNESWDISKYKGKVVLVDFWASWCPPCREEVPKVAKLYADYHDKGLEIIGVNSDVEKEDLQSFLKDHPEMPWTELFHGGPSRMHPLGTKFGIPGIPTMYIVDRNGLLRSVDGVRDKETLIPKLLEEPETPAEPAKARH